MEIQNLAVRKQRWGTEIVLEMIAKSFSTLPSKLKVKLRHFRRGREKNFNRMIEGLKI